MCEGVFGALWELYSDRKMKDLVQLMCVKCNQSNAVSQTYVGGFRNVKNRSYTLSAAPSDGIKGSSLD